MEKHLAHFISKVFSPLFMGVIFFAIAFNLQYYFSTSIPQNARWMVLGLVSVTTFIIPALLGNVIHALLKNKIAMAGKDARLIPLAIAAVFYLGTYHLLDRISLSPIFNLFILGMASLSVVSMLIIIVKDISLYMVAAGALLGVFISLQLTLGINLIFFIILSLLLGGLIGFSRLYLERHKPHDIYIGFITGTAVMMLHYLYL